MRIIRALYCAAKELPKTPSAWEKFLYRADGYCKYGLVKDDLLTEFNEHVVEALRRLPEDLVNQRIFRHNRAAILSMTHRILPEDQWTKMDEDKPYLESYVAEVEAEAEEKKTWIEKNPL